MAQEKRVIVTDDLDGSEAAKTYTFAFNGTQYEIDLGAASRDALIRALQPFIDSSRRVGSKASNRSASGSADDSRAVRDWARANGLTVPDRGRIPKAVREAYASR
ncbi:Lsr2 family protein [uncultured Cellulomonas sp.]|uniref:histone-like nucleoid-structuring protein Lsr2 n=1 Tax=uncultured Cellulomonas sp. TaxID=189682 RepID=UPI00261996A3|nr:Lsr2 family protein [uncultured Cellulomonas sp.]